MANTTNLGWVLPGDNAGFQVLHGVSVIWLSAGNFYYPPGIVIPRSLLLYPGPGPGPEGYGSVAHQP